MNKGFITALLIFLTPILVITVSTVWYYSGYGPEERVNYGHLLTDPIDVGNLNLELDYQNLNVDSMERKWMLVHFINDTCLESCADLIYVVIVGPVTFPFNPVISQKTSYKGTKANPKPNIPKVKRINFRVLFRASISY